MTELARWEIRHTSTYTYDTPVQESQNELRVCPGTDEVQSLLHHRATTTPGARVQSYVDYWGTRVETFGVRGPHLQLEVVAESSVVVAERPPVPAVVTPLSVLREDGVRGDHAELLTPTQLVGLDDDIVGLAREATRSARGIWEAASMLCAHVAAEVELVDGRTDPGRTVDAVLRGASGSARDRAHALAALCRGLGVPTLYVSGHHATDGGEAAARLDAWVEVLIPDQGWHALDPAGDVGTGHVTIGRGRDHADVPPLRGAFVGGRDHELVVTVVSQRTADLQQQQQQQQ